MWCGRETSTPNRHKSTITGAVPWFMAVVYHGVEVSLSLRSYFYSVQVSPCVLEPSVTQVHRSAQPYLYWTCVYRWELLTVSRRDWHEANRQQILPAAGVNYQQYRRSRSTVVDGEPAAVPFSHDCIYLFLANTRPHGSTTVMQS